MDRRLAGRSKRLKLNGPEIKKWTVELDVLKGMKVKGPNTENGRFKSLRRCTNARIKIHGPTNNHLSVESDQVSSMTKIALSL